MTFFIFGLDRFENLRREGDFRVKIVVETGFGGGPMSNWVSGYKRRTAVAGWT